MIGIVVVAHGGLAQAMVEVVRSMLGPRDALEAVTTGPHATPDDLRDAVRGAIGRVDRGDGVIILTDMLGDTQTNVSVEVAREAGVEVLAGVNMPILVKLASEGSVVDRRSLAAFLCRYGQEHIFWATEQVPAPGRVRRRA